MKFTYEMTLIKIVMVNHNIFKASSHSLVDLPVGFVIQVRSLPSWLVW